MFDLSGKTALVTGGGRGLGLEMAKALATAGATVAINGRHREALEAARRRCAGDGIALDIAPGDVTVDAGQIIDAAVEKTGRLDILIHAVGERDRRGTDTMDPASFAALINTDLTAAYGMAKTALPHLRRSSSGRLISSPPSPPSRPAPAIPPIRRRRAALAPSPARSRSNSAPTR